MNDQTTTDGWKIKGTTHEGDGYPGVEVRGPDGVTAFVSEFDENRVNGGPSEAEMKTAGDIVKACNAYPDLLAACKTMLESMNEHAENYGGDFEEKAARGYAAMLSAAIAKAEGC